MGEIIFPVQIGSRVHSALSSGHDLL